MFIVLYEMKAKEGCNSEFEQAWAEVTEHIYSRLGSLGSRLHRTDEAGHYLAYAQWPSKEAFLGNDGSAASDSELQARARMRESLKESKILYQMIVVDDRLRKE